MSALNTGIYEIKNTANGKRYVGSAIDFQTRFRTHLNNLRKNKHSNRHLQFAWNKYGEQSFVFNVILYCSPRNLLFYEQRALDVYNTLYNLAPTAGSQLGVHFSDEGKANISKAKKGKSITKPPPRSDEHRAAISKALKGKKLSEETRRKMSESQKMVVRTPLSEETKRKISESKKGRSTPWNKGKTGVYSQETLARISETSTGRVFSEESRQKMSASRKGRPAWNKGIPHTPEAVAKIAEASRNRRHSPETRRKISEKIRIAHAEGRCGYTSNEKLS
jgi:group I intron endonuclease